jgi:signal transduction histidine kinase
VTDERRRWQARVTELEGSVQAAGAALARERRRARLLADVTRSLAAAFDQRLEAQMQVVAERVVRELADWCLIDGPDDLEEGRFRRLAVAHPRQVDPARLDRLGRVGDEPLTRPGLPTLLTSPPDGGRGRGLPDRWSLLQVIGGHSLASTPLLARGKPLGALTLVRIEPEPALTDEDLALAAQVADRCACAIDGARLAREAREAIQVRDEFMTIASHELKTPLTPLQLQIHTLEKHTRDLVRDDACGAWLEHRLATIRRQSDRLDRLVGELLDMSRLMGGRLHLELERVDLREITRATVAEFSERTDLPRSEVRIEVPSGIVGQWDRLRLEQVLTNLLSNALKYGGGEPVTISARVAGGHALFTVEDRGIGIAPEDQERVFRRFEQAVPSRQYGGFGLGLFITKQLVEALGGMITVRSELARGSAFTVSLPLAGPTRHGSSWPGALEQHGGTA